MKRGEVTIILTTDNARTDACAFEYVPRMPPLSDAFWWPVRDEPVYLYPQQMADLRWSMQCKEGTWERKRKRQRRRARRAKRGW